MMVFTGDVVKEGASVSSWQTVFAQLEPFNIPFYVAAGNHDVGISLSSDKLKVFRQQFDYQNLRVDVRGDVHLIFDVSTTGWKFTKQHIEMIAQAVADLQQTGKRLFIYVHQLVWWDPLNRFVIQPPNNGAGRKGKSNFWRDVTPLLNQLNSPSFVISGDVGAFENKNALGFVKCGGTLLIASGMGGQTDDNVLLFEIGETVSISKIPLGDATGSDQTFSDHSLFEIDEPECTEPLLSLSDRVTLKLNQWFDWGLSF